MIEINERLTRIRNEQCEGQISVATTGDALHEEQSFVDGELGYAALSRCLRRPGGGLDGRTGSVEIVRRRLLFGSAWPQ